MRVVISCWTFLIGCHFETGSMKMTYRHALWHKYCATLKFSLNTLHLRSRLWGITTECVRFIPQSLVLRSIVSGWILIYQNWFIVCRQFIPVCTIGCRGCIWTPNGQKHLVSQSMCTCDRYFNRYVIFCLLAETQEYALNLSLSCGATNLIAKRTRFKKMQITEFPAS